jgi:hypothetical protein
LYEIYDIENVNRFPLEENPIYLLKLNIFIETITKFDKNYNTDPNYHACAIEQMLCFLIYPKTQFDKEILWKKIINYIKICKISNSYDIIKKYNISHNFMMPNDIIIIFDSNIENILQYVKMLKNNDNICKILFGLYDNNTVRILFENDDIHEIIFNNYKTCNIKLLEKCIPVDNTIKLIFDILSQNNDQLKYPNFTEYELRILSKYLFTNSVDTQIYKLVKHYKIMLCE